MSNQFAKDYFDFTAKERRGVIIIISVILLLILLPFFYPLLVKQHVYNHSDFANEITKLETEAKDSSKLYSKSYANNFPNDYSSSGEKKYIPLKAEVFYFDPNTASAEDWRRLGVRDRTIHTIQNYLSKGGKFYKPQDIRKIWGLSTADAMRLIQYVSIKNNTSFPAFEKKQYSKTVITYPVKSVQPIDVNLADTSQLISLPGIGSKLSNRIISFREKLGGFYSVDQVAETYLLPDSTFQKIRSRLVINNVKVKQININSASVEEMKAHPYLRYNLANAIFKYRQQHGNFNSVEEIKNIMLVTEETFQKIAPYLSVQ